MKLEKHHGIHDAGKGSYTRPTNQSKYAENYDRIFGKKEKPNPEDYKQTSWCCDEELFDKNVSTVVD
jgi:hypothetical protein